MVGDARLYFELELLVCADASVALTLRTGLLDHRALPRAAGARRHGHELSEHGARGPAHFARSGAGAAARGLGAGRRPGAAARGAAVQWPHLHLFGAAAGHLGVTALQRDLHALAALELASRTLDAAEERVHPGAPAGAR